MTVKAEDKEQASKPKLEVGDAVEFEGKAGEIKAIKPDGSYLIHVPKIGSTYLSILPNDPNLKTAAAWKTPPMPPDMVAAIQFCMGPPLTPAHCRQHVMTGPYDEECQHGGLDHICGELLAHPNRHRCCRDGCAFEWVQ
jgi:hypothetical protein